MSWTDFFPVFSDEQISSYLEKSSPEEGTQLEEWFEVAQIINPRSSKHLVVATLFWKNLVVGESPLPPITRDLMKNARKHGLISRYDPWPHYVQPLLNGATHLAAARPDVVFRVYLAADLEFLVPDLLEVGCEVMLMKSSSISHNPGAMWRFLALEEEGRWVTVTDSDRVPEILHDVARTEATLAAGFGIWRVPYVLNDYRMNYHPGYYRTMNACHFGIVGGYPAALMMKAFVWHTLRNEMPNRCGTGVKGGNSELVEIFGSKWPDYGFDEWFLNAVIYPRAAFTGVATFSPINGAQSHWFTLDVEYVTWANPSSEVIYYGNLDFLKRRQIQRTKKKPSSQILEGMLTVKREQKRASLDRSNRVANDPLTLVVARYEEDLNWLLTLPEEIEIVVYNKGRELEDETLSSRINHLVSLPNVGREADTYLYHVQNFKHGSNDSWTVFCQGDPFPHQPHLVQLFEHRDVWNDIQCLTSGYAPDTETPPEITRILQDEEWINGIPVRSELCSSHTLNVINWHDEPWTHLAAEYRAIYGIPRGWSLSGHFLEQCGLIELAENAWQAILSSYAIAAIFGVRNRQLNTIPTECIPKMREMACADACYGFMYERLWLHLFGLPFTKQTSIKGKIEPQEKQLAVVF